MASPLPPALPTEGRGFPVPRGKTVQRLPQANSPFGVRNATKQLRWLLTGDNRLRAWAASAGPMVPLETVEQWFQRLASASLGQPRALDGLPLGAEAAAALLVLREFMHHLGYRSVLVV